MDFSQLRRDSVFQKCLDQMVKVVAATREQEEPFSHFQVNDLLPRDIYQELVARKPAVELYGASSQYAAVSSETPRRTFSLTDKSLSRLCDADRQLWLGVRDAFGSKQFRSAVFARLSKGLAYRFGIHESETAGLRYYPLPDLYRETAGYSIAPHPDTRRKVVTMQFCLAADDSQADLGTEFYRLSLNPLNLLREPRGFEIVKRPPFLPNSCNVFTVLNTVFVKSWHGRTTLRADSGTRDSLLNIWYANAEDGNPDILREHYADELQMSAARAA